MTEPLVSIITPNYNCGEFISKTIESVLAQTYKNWQMLIVDDRSTDSSWQTALSYAQKDSRIRVFQNERNSGAAVSRNRALDEAEGEYIAFLDSDDLWHPEKLERQIRFMKENGCDFCYTEYELIDDSGRSLHRIAKAKRRLTYRQFLFHDFVGCLTVMYRRDIASDIRSYNIKNNNDYGLFLQIMRKADRAMGMPECLARYRIHTTGISRNKRKKIKPFIKLMTEHLGYPYILALLFMCTNVLVGRTWKYRRG